VAVHDDGREPGTPSRPEAPKVNLPWPEIATRVVVWLFLGAAINLLPLVIAYITGAGEQPNQKGPGSLTLVLSSGDLLIATTAMLPPSLADLAINVKGARHVRIIIVVVGGFLSLLSLLFYGFAFANDLSQQSHTPMVAKHLSPHAVALLSGVFFLSAVLIGAVCVAFLASGEADENG
jgi:hypothetical protein